MKGRNSFNILVLKPYIYIISEGFGREREREMAGNPALRRCPKSLNPFFATLIKNSIV
jgi:hypothetical protein